MRSQVAGVMIAWPNLANLSVATVFGSIIIKSLIHPCACRQWHRLLASVAILGLAACRESSTGPYEITEVREMDPSHAFEQPILATSSADRFGYSKA